MKKATLRDVAEHLGMGKTTVHRVLSGAPHVSGAKRERVLAAARELGYEHDVYFSSLSAKRRQKGASRLTLAYLHAERAPGHPDRKGVDLTQALLAESASMGFAIEHMDPDSFSSPDRLLRQLWSRGAVGILVGAVGPETAAALRGFGKLPVVSLIREEELPFHTVRYSVGQALELCWKKLHERGFRRIGCAVLTHAKEIPDDVERLGTALAMAERDLSPEERIPPLRSSCGFDGFKPWLWHHKPEAVIGFSPGLQWLCKTRGGRRVPFVTLHASLSEPACHIPGALEPLELHARQALRQMDGLVRIGECGIPAHAYELVVHTVWHEGAGLG